MAGETEDNGARAVDIHGARAYHQTLFAWLLGEGEISVSARACLALFTRCFLRLKNALKGPF
jgi:hypothetical protein